jgi:hypothetical protein
MSFKSVSGVCRIEYLKVQVSDTTMSKKYSIAGAKKALKLNSFHKV